MPRIAVVDDSEDTLEIFVFCLEREFGSDGVQSFSRAASFLTAFRNQPFDLTILDISMPGMDGFEVLERLRLIDPNARVIAVSAYGMTLQRERALAAGYCEYVTKPVMDIEDFCKMVRRYLDLKSDTIAL